MTRFSFGLILAACISISFSVLWEGFVTPIAAQNEAANGGTLRGTITDLTPEQNPIEGVDVQNRTCSTNFSNGQITRC